MTWIEHGSICHLLVLVTKYATNIAQLVAQAVSSSLKMNHQKHKNAVNAMEQTVLLVFYFWHFYSSSFEVVQRPFNIRPVRNSNNALNTHYEFVYVNFIPYLTCFPHVWSYDCHVIPMIILKSHELNTWFRFEDVLSIILYGLHISV